MLQEGLPACFFSPCNSGAVCDSSRKTSHHVRGCWMSLLPGSTCVLQPLSRGDPSSAALSRAEDKSTRLLSYGSDTHVLRPAAGSAGGVADQPPTPPRLPNWRPGLRPILCCAAQVTTAHMKCIPGGAHNGLTLHQNGPNKEFPVSQCYSSRGG